MAHVKVRGFVIREVPVGEADRIITILTADMGLITASVRRARRPSGALLLSTQVYSLSQFELFQNKGYTSVSAAELIEPFLKLHQDVERLVCAAHLAEVLLDACRDETAQPELYRLWAYYLQALQQTPDPFFTVHIAQLRLLSDIGFAPRLGNCVVCSRPIVAGQPVWFSVQACGSLCGRAECRSPGDDARPVSGGTWNCLKYCIETPLARLFQCQVSLEVRQEFCAISERYLFHQMEKSYSKLNILNQLSTLAGQQAEAQQRQAH
jgi:DNA repair protein RecO (recombination protein O)